ncbi:MAG: hypothetical protein H6741_00270 [Alphaproteobacteria bacterium]|nr:hypothetical protein [Alphaproteobacteria bacterium]
MVQVDFRPTAAGTTLEMCHRFPTAEACRRTIEEYGAVEGGRQTLARLERLLERG